MKLNLIKKLLFVFIFIHPFISFSSVIIKGYTDKLSYRDGDVVTFFINTGVNSTTPYDFKLFDINGAVVYTIYGIDVPVQAAPTSTEPWKDGYGYAPSNHTWSVPSYSTLKSGLYFIDNVIPIIIKGDLSTAELTIVYPTNTDAAYNDFDGICMYPFCSTTSAVATTVSFQRPWKLQRLEAGFLKWLASNNYYSINLISDMDLDADVADDEIGAAKVLIIVGHSEYWTRKARENFDKFVDNGGNALVLSGNTMWWQVRYNDDRTKMTCYKSYSADDGTVYNATNDPLLRTDIWYYPEFKYSILGSIGADSHHGGMGIEGMAQHNDCNAGAFNGFRILLDGSPILSGTGLNYNDVLSFPNGEYDGTLIKNLDTNNETINGDDPLLDVSALGFYRAEMIGYDITNYLDQPSPNQYCPLMAFQRTCNSGKVINVNANMWCSDYVIGGTAFDPGYNLWYTNGSSCDVMWADDSLIRAITKNMIDLLLNNDNIFVNSAPDAFIITPGSQQISSYPISNEPTTVSYTACLTAGAIVITDCGVTLQDAYDNSYRVDNFGGDFIAGTEDCYSPAHSVHREMMSNVTNNKEITIYPNPVSGNLFIQSQQAVSSITITDITGKKLLTTKQTTINVSSFAQGIYFISIQTKEGVVSKKFVKQ